jgi:23S rRNA (adenine2503-C2)-methyltransferase
MGEPMLNWSPVEYVARHFLDSKEYHFYISTVGVFVPEAIAGILALARKYPHFGLQFSLHETDEVARKQLLGNYPNLLTLGQVKHLADSFQRAGDNQAYFNYICKGGETPEQAEAVTRIVGKHHLTCSVLCDTAAFAKAAQEPALRFGEMCSVCPDWSHDWSVFDPAGQDTIGGGCGQLLFVQEFLAGKRSLSAKAE